MRMADKFAEHGSLDGLVLKATDKIANIKDKSKGREISTSLRRDLESITPAEFAKVRADRREDLKALLSTIAGDTTHTENTFAKTFLKKMQ